MMDAEGSPYTKCGGDRHEDEGQRTRIEKDGKEAEDSEKRK